MTIHEGPLQTIRDQEESIKTMKDHEGPLGTRKNQKEPERTERNKKNQGGLLSTKTGPLGAGKIRKD